MNVVRGVPTNPTAARRDAQRPQFAPEFPYGLGEGAMSILQEILAWTQGLPAWQSDAVARLLAKRTLTAQDQDDLFALLKLAHGIPDP